MNPKRSLVVKTLLTTLSVPTNTLNLRNTFTLIANSKIFEKDPTITPNYVAGVWYNYLTKYKNGDTTNKAGNKNYCFVIHGTDNSMILPNRKCAKNNIPYNLYVDEEKNNSNEQ